MKSLISHTNDSHINNARGLRPNLGFGIFFKKKVDFSWPYCFALFLPFLVHCDPSLYRCDFTPFAETNTAIHRHPENYGSTQSNDLFF